MQTGKLIPLWAVVLFAAALATGGDFTLDWWTVDGGGAMWTADPIAQYELSGSIGQPDASATVMTGGGFEVSSGFWTQAGSHEVTPVTPESVEPLDDVVDDITPQPGPP